MAGALPKFFSPTIWGLIYIFNVIVIDVASQCILFTVFEGKYFWVKENMYDSKQ